MKTIKISSLVLYALQIFFSASAAYAQEPATYNRSALDWLRRIRTSTVTLVGASGSGGTCTLELMNHSSFVQEDYSIVVSSADKKVSHMVSQGWVGGNEDVLEFSAVRVWDSKFSSRRIVVTFYQSRVTHVFASLPGKLNSTIDCFFKRD